MSEKVIKYNFSTENYKRIPFEKYEKNFTFIVNGQQYKTSRFLADLLSPTICKYHYSDETIEEFILNTKSSTNNDTFSSFLEIIENGEKEIESDACLDYSEYFLHLGNVSEYSRLQAEFFDEINNDNIISRISAASKMLGGDQSAIQIEGNFRNLVKYASSHFYEISREEMKSVESRIFEEIIKDEDLRLEEEDDLFEVILAKYEKNHQDAFLFEYVEFNHLKVESLRKFASVFDIGDMNVGTWRSICELLFITKCAEAATPRNNDRHRYKCMEINEEGKGGIMSYLSEKSGGNIHDNKTIEIISNSIYSNRYPRNIVDYQSDNFYETDGEENSEICFDFKDKRIQVTSYTIKTNHWEQNDNHLKNWVLEASNDQQVWNEIDKHENDQSLNGPNLASTFRTKEAQAFYRFIRLRQTGKNWYNNYYTVIKSLDFYGKLKE